MKNYTYFLKAVDPGYTLDHKSNVGELVELYVKDASPGHLVSLAGLTLSYTKSGGDEEFLLARFSELSYASGETILLRLAGTVGADQSNLTYQKQTGFTGLLFEGKLTLRLNGEIIDEVEWGEKKPLEKFSSNDKKFISRDMETLEFAEYPIDDAAKYPVYHPENYIDKTVVEEDDPAAVINSQCKGLEFSEILSYYSETQSEQFIELHNSTSEQMRLDGCSLRYKNKTYELSGVMKADAYYARYLTDFSITKNPTNSNTIEILDTTGEIVDTLIYPNGQKKGASYAFLNYDEQGEEIWRTTYLLTPNEPNVYQEYKTCEEGKVINKATGNCVKVTLVSEKTCSDGYFLNPLTNRCNKIKTATTTAECAEGYERNPDTNRCRKITVNTGADYSLNTETYEESSSFVALYAVIAVVVIGLGYAIFEFRKDLLRLFRKVFQRFH